MSTALMPAEVQEPPDDILIVMDDQFLRKLARRAVEGLGLCVREAVSVARAKAHLREDPAALVLLDLWIEHGRGLELLQALHDSPPEMQVPVLLLGKGPPAHEIARATALGALGPVPVSEIHRIGTWIELAPFMTNR